MSAHLTEEEQIEALKRWWKDYGKTVVVAVVIGLGAFFAWNFYQDKQAERAREHSIAFEQLINSATATEGELSDEQAQQVAQLASELADTDSLYADFAKLYLAKLAVQQDDLDDAQSRLREVVEGGENAAVQDLARLRLARVLASKGEVDNALALLSAQPGGAYATIYAETRGDILLAQNRLPDARSAYEAALASVGNQPMRRNILQLKLDNTRTAADSPAAVPTPANDPHARPNPHAAEAGDAS